MLKIIIAFLFLASTANATTYVIGAGQTYETFTALEAAVVLAAGDIVDGGGCYHIRAHPGLFQQEEKLHSDRPFEYGGRSALQHGR